MDEVLTLAEIEARYPDEWILVEDPELDEQLEVVRGKVVAHSPDREEFDREIVTLQPQSSAFVYTGSVPDDVEFLL